jgi:hypothetical protein
MTHTPETAITNLGRDRARPPFRTWKRRRRPHWAPLSKFGPNRVARDDANPCLFTEMTSVIGGKEVCFEACLRRYARRAESAPPAARIGRRASRRRRRPPSPHTYVAPGRKPAAFSAEINSSPPPTWILYLHACKYNSLFRRTSTAADSCSTTHSRPRSPPLDGSESGSGIKEV